MIMLFKRWLPIVFLSFATVLNASEPDKSFSLPGKWRFDLDRADQGINQHWFEKSLQNSIRLPGSLPEQDIGDDVALETKWTGGIIDKFFFTAPQFAKYREPR